MNKIKLFISNFVIYGLSGVINNAIPLIMIPIVVRLMPNSSYFGISDMATTIVSFGSALAIMGMYDAMYRMFFEREDIEFKKEICSTAFAFTLFMSFLISIIMILGSAQISKVFFGDIRYKYIVYIAAFSTLVGSTNAIVSAPTKMQNKRKVYVLTNFASPAIAYSLLIILIHYGLYEIGYPLSYAVSALLIEVVYIIINREWFSKKYIKIEHIKPLLRIALPLMPNFLIYWIFNSSDKLMITSLIGIENTGVYSVGAKLGMVSQLIYIAFSSGWQYFSFSTMNEENQVENNTKVYEYLGVISFVATMIMSLLSKHIFHILFTEEYAKASIVAIYLFFAPLLQMLFQIGANQFLIIKKTWPNLVILSGGAILNIILNIFLIPRIGIEGAAIATVFGYFFSDIICYIILVKMKLMIPGKRFVITTLLLLFYFVVWRFWLVENTTLNIVVIMIIIYFFCRLYWEDILLLKRSLRK